MAKTEKYFVGPQLLGEIRQTITRVAGMPDRTSGVSLPVVHQDLPRRGGGGEFRYASWPADWQSLETATITFLTNSSQTATAVNTFAGVGPGEGWVAKRDGTWHLAVVNLTMQPNYVAGETQLLGHSTNGIMRWYSVTQCGTATATP